MESSWELVVLADHARCNLCFADLHPGLKVWFKHTKLVPHVRYMCAKCHCETREASPAQPSSRPVTHTEPARTAETNQSASKAFIYHSGTAEAKSDDGDGREDDDASMIADDEEDEDIQPNKKRRTANPTSSTIASSNPNGVQFTPRAATSSYMRTSDLRNSEPSSSRPPRQQPRVFVPEEDEEYEADSFIASEEDEGSEPDDFDAEDEEDDDEECFPQPRDAAARRDRKKTTKTLLQGLYELDAENDDDVQKIAALDEVDEDEDEVDSDDDDSDDDGGNDYGEEEEYEDDEEDTRAYRAAAETMLYCSVCGCDFVKDDFSSKQQKVLDDDERFCLRHTGTSAFGSTFKKPRDQARGLRLVFSSASPAADHTPQLVSQRTMQRARAQSSQQQRSQQRSLSSSRDQHQRGRRREKEVARTLLYSDNEEDEEVEFSPSKVRQRRSPPRETRTSSRSTRKIASYDSEGDEDEEDEDEEEEEEEQPRRHHHRKAKTKRGQKRPTDYDEEDDEEVEFDATVPPVSSSRVQRGKKSSSRPRGRAGSAVVERRQPRRAAQKALQLLRNREDEDDEEEDMVRRRRRGSRVSDADADEEEDEDYQQEDHDAEEDESEEEDEHSDAEDDAGEYRAQTKVVSKFRGSNVNASNNHLYPRSGFEHKYDTSSSSQHQHLQRRSQRLYTVDEEEDGEEEAEFEAVAQPKDTSAGHSSSSIKVPLQAAKSVGALEYEKDRFGLGSRTRRSLLVEDEEDEAAGEYFRPSEEMHQDEDGWRPNRKRIVLPESDEEEEDLHMNSQQWQTNRSGATQQLVRKVENRNVSSSRSSNGTTRPYQLPSRTLSGRSIRTSSARNKTDTVVDLTG